MSHQLTGEMKELLQTLDDAAPQQRLPGVGGVVKYYGHGRWGVPGCPRRWQRTTVQALERRGLLRASGPRAYERQEGV